MDVCYRVQNENAPAMLNLLNNKIKDSMQILLRHFICLLTFLKQIRKCDKEVELNCDVLLLIFAKLNNAKELCKLRCVCKTWNSCATSSFLWKKICIATVGPLPPSLLQISPFNPNNATTKLQRSESTKAEEVEDNNISYFTLYKQFISSLPTVESVEVNTKNADMRI